MDKLTNKTIDEVKDMVMLKIGDTGNSFIVDDKNGIVYKQINGEIYEHHSLTNLGYDRVCLAVDGSYRRIQAHRFIVEVALGIELKSYQPVHHINGKKTDNRLKNLLICDSSTTHKEIHSIDPKYYNTIVGLLNSWALEGKIVTLEDVKNLERTIGIDVKDWNRNIVKY